MPLWGQEAKARPMVPALQPLALLLMLVEMLSAAFVN
jgi:hypothetical protein